jgi:hypothetical protein
MFFIPNVQCIHTLLVVNVIFVYNFLISQAFLFIPKNIHTLVNVIFVYNYLISQAFLFTPDNLLKPSQKQRVSCNSDKKTTTHQVCQEDTGGVVQSRIF